MGLSRSGIGPRALPCQRASLRPDAVRQREGTYPVPRYRRIDSHHVPRNLLLHDVVGILVEHRMPQRVCTQLETIRGEPAHLLEAPLPVLTVPLRSVAEEVVT